MRAHSKIYGLIVAQVQYAKKPGQLDIETRLAIVQLYLY